MSIEKISKGIKLMDSLTNTAKALQFNAEAPQVCSQNYLQAIGEGNILNHIIFNKFGRVSNVGTSTVDVWSGGSIYVFPATAQKMDIVSSSAQDKGTTTVGTGVQIVRIIGLDATYTQITEDVTLDGTNIVTTTNSFLRINRLYAIQCGTSLAAAGTITAKGTGGAVVYSQIDINLTSDRQLIYTVPLGKTLYVTSIRVGAGIGGTSVKNEFCTFTAKATTDGTNVYNFFLPFAEIGVMNGSIQLPVEEVQKIPATTDIKASVIGDSAQGALCTSAVRGWLE